MRKYIIASLTVATALFCGAIVFIWCATYTVASGEKNGSKNDTIYGYRIEQYRFWNSMRLTIWNKQRLNYGVTSVYEIDDVTVDRVVEERWLNNDSTLYLNIQLKQVDSLIKITYARMLYDFPRDEMYTAGVWPTLNRGSRPDDEFNTILNSLSP